MQNAVRDLLIAGTRIAIGFVVSAPTVPRVPAVCDPVVDKFAVVAERNKMEKTGCGRLALSSPLINAVYTVPLPTVSASRPTNGMDNVSDTRRPSFAQIHSAPRLDQWAVDARGNPLPWIIAPSGKDSI